ncbi:MAG: NAD(P)-dependent oxidoreductase [Candidatus Lokiarchaeota archaeon]|nr:NAD(P)-dependent oxidoreductase [Candidatus Lokiarchaeota archaeon]
MKIFITGATGQLGHSLIRELIKGDMLSINSPQEIVCLVRNPEQAGNLHDMNITIVQGTLKDKNYLKHILSEHKIDIIFHCAAISNPSADKELLFSTNIDGSNNLLDAFVESPQTHSFVFSSSISVYDSYLKSDGTPLTEDAKFGSLTKGDPYAISKRMIEQEITHLQKLHPEKRFYIARIGPMSGTHDRIILPMLITLMSKQRLPKLIGKGRKKISIIAPEDAARAMVFLTQNSKKDSNHVYNVTGNMISYKEMFDCVASYYGIEYSNFSIPYWLFRILRPIIWLIRIFFPKNKFVQMVFSETALAFFNNSYEYDSNKIQNLGFKFLYSPLESIRMGLETMDHEKELIASKQDNCKTDN